MKNPIAITTAPPAGQQLPYGWASRAQAVAKQASDAYLDKLQNAWKQPSNIQGNLIQQARLNSRNDSSQAPHNTDAQKRHDGAQDRFDGAQHRFDGALVLIEERSDGFQLWRDNVSGATVWRRLGWKDVIGEK
jgi:hypothetical protein